MANGLGNIAGTLSGLDAKTLAEAEQQRQQEELAARTLAAVLDSQQASQNYQQALNAPPPQLDPFSQLIPALFGDIGSILSGNPAYGERGHQQVAISRAMLLDNRARSLERQRQISLAKAEVAQRAGDFEAEDKARTSHERLSRAYEQVEKAQAEQSRRDLEQQQHGFRTSENEAQHQARLGEIAASGAEQRKTQAAKPASTPGERARMVTAGLDPDSGLPLSTFMQREITRRSALAKRDDKSRNEATNQITDVAYQRWSSDVDPKTMGHRLLKLRSPFEKATPKEARYLLTGERVYKMVHGKPVVDADAELRAKGAARSIVMPYFESGQ